jgi:hypothetical protein
MVRARHISPLPPALHTKYLCFNYVLDVEMLKSNTKPWFARGILGAGD